MPGVFRLAGLCSVRCRAAPVVGQDHPRSRVDLGPASESLQLFLCLLVSLFRQLTILLMDVLVKMVSLVLSAGLPRGLALGADVAGVLLQQALVGADALQVPLAQLPDVVEGILVLLLARIRSLAGHQAGEVQWRCALVRISLLGHEGPSCAVT